VTPSEHERQSSASRFASALGWVDCTIEREILRLRGRYELSLDELRGLYVSDQQVDRLLHERLSPGSDGDPASALSERARFLHRVYRASPPWLGIAKRLQLSDAEFDLLLLALAPEIDLRYATLYAYLNNDIARRYLTADLAQRLLTCSQSDSDLTPTVVRTLLSPCSALVSQGILEPLESAPGTSSLLQGYTVTPVVAQATLALPIADPRWPRDVRWLEPGALAEHDAPIVSSSADVFLLAGDDADELRRLARHVARSRGWRLIGTPAAALTNDVSLGVRLQLAARLGGGALLIDCVGEDHTAAVPRVVRECAQGQVPVLLTLGVGSSLAESLGDVPHVRMSPAVLHSAERARRWASALERADLPIDPALVERLADSFALNGQRIDAAVRSVSMSQERETLSQALEREASARSNEALARLAPRVVRPHRWSDLVLPDNALQQLREVAQAVACRERVYRRWALIERTGRSAGLMIFFSGASGTGKTMAASVIANEVGLELYRVDLASVVSKYIGETEKNLERIFTAARRSSAILLFDEADALLGKRSEIADAHDRYANIEVAYLLQKMEEHDGVVILASNLAKNLDPAFARRMHYQLEFARPSAPLRERLWRGMFPPSAPLADDVDFAFLAEGFETTGGEIQAIALDAAFLAAASQCSIGMTQLMRAMTRRQTKHGNPGGLERYREHRRALEGRANGASDESRPM
jgi:SpoVK/Ycf46/Vps4 family AAA+-type ATPase